MRLNKPIKRSGVKRKRKRKKLTVRKSKPKVFSQEYLEYIRSSTWKAYCKTIIQFWDGRCAICYQKGPLQVHHRHYGNLGRETLTDCIPVCVGQCHKVCDKRRQIAARKRRKS